MSAGTAIKKGLKHLVRVPIYSKPSFNTVSTRPYLIKALEQARWAGQQPAGLFIDIQGQHVSRSGRLSTMALYINDGQKHNMIYIIDLKTLGESAFAEITEEEFADARLVHKDGRRKVMSEYVQRGLKGLLESEQVKVFWDIRRTADALYNQFGIRLNGVREVQLMEYATRPVIGDPANIYPGLMMRPLDAMRVISTPMVDKVEQERVAKFFSRYNVRAFQSPTGLRADIVEEQIFKRPYDFSTDFFKFCLSNVRLLPTIYDTYAPLLTRNHWKLVQMATDKRLAKAQEKDYDAWNDRGIAENLETPWTMPEKAAVLNERGASWRRLADTATEEQVLKKKPTKDNTAAVQDKIDNARQTPFPEPKIPVEQSLKETLKGEPAETATENREVEVATQTVEKSAEQSTMQSGERIAEEAAASSTAKPSELQLELPTEEAGQIIEEKPSDGAEEQTTTPPTENSPVEANETIESNATSETETIKEDTQQPKAETVEESKEDAKEEVVEPPKEDEKKKSTWGWF